jgi:hypothetical protein
MRRRLQPDNVIFVPASLLPFKHEWIGLVDKLPMGDALFVVPEADEPIRRSMKVVARELRRRGRHIAAISANQFAPKS